MAVLVFEHLLFERGDHLERNAHAYLRRRTLGHHRFSAGVLEYLVEHCLVWNTLGQPLRAPHF